MHINSILIFLNYYLYNIEAMNGGYNINIHRADTPKYESSTNLSFSKKSQRTNEEFEKLEEEVSQIKKLYTDQKYLSPHMSNKCFMSPQKGKSNEDDSKIKVKSPIKEIDDKITHALKSGTDFENLFEELFKEKMIDIVAEDDKSKSDEGKDENSV